MDEKHSYIVGLGSYLPEKVLSNRDLEKMVDTSHDWIVQRTGITERRIAHEGQAASDMGRAAAKEALKEANIAASDVEMLIVATMTPDHIAPSTSCLIQRALGAEKAAAIDIQAACTGFLYALSMAKAYIESGVYQTILIVATEKMSTVVDYTDRNTCILFGDGAAAALVTSKNVTGRGLRVDTVTLGADGNQADLISIPAGGSRQPSTEGTIKEKLHYVRLEGREVFKHAVRRMAAAAEKCLSYKALTPSDIAWLIPHQANERIMDATAENVGVPLEKMFKTVHKYGNTSASGIAIALHELVQEKLLKNDSHVLLVAFGAGFTWGAALLTKKEGDKSK